MNEYHKILLDILLEIDRICRKNDIEYALAYGSALGLVNYGGFIPWDGDADVIMTKPNWDRFVAACSADLSPDFVLDCPENNDSYDIFIPKKVRKTNTRVKEKFVSEYMTKHGSCRGAFVDVQVFLPVDEDYTEYLRAMKRNLLREALDLFVPGKRKAFKRRMRQWELEYAERHADSSVWNQTPLTGCAWFHAKNRSTSYPKECLFPFTEREFEGHKLFTVHDPETFCRLNYGDDCLKPELYPDKLKKSQIKRYWVDGEERHIN